MVIAQIVLIAGFLLFFSGISRMVCKREKPHSQRRADPLAAKPRTYSVAAVLPVPSPAPSAPQKRGRPLAATSASAVMPAPNATGCFSGEVVAFSGTLDCATREAAMNRVAIAGGHAYDTMPAGTTLLVVGKNPGKNKLEKARRWNIPVMDESAFKRRFSPNNAQAQTTASPAPVVSLALSLAEFAARISA
ncbi:MAG: BRCT domain-containing protein [Eubacteriales bacterium]|nr:BRCT domain-containing protein [Eubacteriales bacterium]